LAFCQGKTVDGDNGSKIFLKDSEAPQNATTSLVQLNEEAYDDDAFDDDEDDDFVDLEEGTEAGGRRRRFRSLYLPDSVFTIAQYRRKAGDYRYLGGSKDCNDNAVTTTKELTNRNKWRAKKVDKGNGKYHYNFDIRDSRKCPRAMLSTPPCDRGNEFNSGWGNKVDLWKGDHESGRLRW